MGKVAGKPTAYDTGGIMNSDDDEIKKSLLDIYKTLERVEKLLEKG